MERFYHIADLFIRMNTFGRTLRQAAAYQIDDCADVDFEIEDITKEYQRKYPYYSDDDAEYMSTGYVFSRHLLEYDGLRIHSSAVVLDGKAYLFSADPGTGKSTHTAKWLEKFGDRAFILNDDKPALRLIDGVWYAYGTPWSGKYDISVNTRAPIAGIAMIERSETNEIEPFTGTEAIHAVLKQSNRPKDMQYRIKLMELLDKLLTMVPIWRFKCNNFEPDAVDVSYSAMSGEREIK